MRDTVLGDTPAIRATISSVTTGCVGADLERLELLL